MPREALGSLDGPRGRYLKDGAPSLLVYAIVMLIWHIRLGGGFWRIINCGLPSRGRTKMLAMSRTMYTAIYSYVYEAIRIAD